MSIAIQVQNLSKAYQIGQIGTGTISRDLERWWVTTVRGKEDPFLKIGETNDRATKGESDIVWSLKDINFEIEQGDAVGIIGRNGAGKSTLLKLLSEVTSPTTGKINIKGRVASLLEVGTGFHPELTGRENIFLNGAILGMRKKEIQRKLDEIIDFSGVERYVDTPVKRYSSGMYVRLAFAVAAHLESEILIVDEVLAVGDAEFQKKCLGKMGDISKGEGRTVLFVSHNMAAIKNLCNKGLLLSNGTLICNDSTSNVLLKYMELQERSVEKLMNQSSIEGSEIINTELWLNYNESEKYSDFDIITSVVFQNHFDVNDCYINFVVESEDREIIIHQRSDFSLDKNPDFKVGRHTANLRIPQVNLKAGVYYYWFRIFCKGPLTDFIIDSEKHSFEVEGKVFGGIINGPSYWDIN